MNDLLIEGPLIVNTAEMWRARMAEALAGSPGLSIDLAGVTETDVFGLQLLCSARRGAEAANKTFRLKNTGGAFARCCELAGFSPAEFSIQAPSLP